MGTQTTDGSQMTVEEARTELRRLKIDFLHRGLFFVAPLPLALIDPAILLALWNWFVVRLGAPSLHYGLAFGLWLLVRFIASPSSLIPVKRGKWPDKYHEVWVPMALVYASRAVTLGAGALAHAILTHS